MSDVPQQGAALQGQIFVSARCALDARSAVAFFAFVAVGALALAGVFAARGYWPILPFAGVELFALGFALGLSLRRGRYREVISVFADRVVVEKGEPGRMDYVELPRAWLVVELAASPRRGHPSRLCLGSHGRRCEIGAPLTEAEREGLGARLRELIAGDGGR